MADQAADQALIQAVLKSDVEGVKKAIQDNADVNVLYEGLYTPFMIAAANAAIDIMRVLLKANANWKFANRNRQTAFALAVKFGRLDTVRFMTEEMRGGPSILWNNVNQELGVPYNLFVEEAAHPDSGSLNRMKGMLDLKLVSGPDAYLTGDRDQERTALMVAKDPAIVKLLLEAGANVNRRDHYGKPVLAYAALDNEQPAEKLQLLFAAGAKMSPELQNMIVTRVVDGAKYEHDKIPEDKLLVLVKNGFELPTDHLDKVPEKVKQEANYQRRLPLLMARYGPGGPMYKRGVMAPKEAGRRRKTVRRRKTKLSRRRIR